MKKKLVFYIIITIILISSLILTSFAVLMINKNSNSDINSNGNSDINSAIDSDIVTTNKVGNTIPIPDFVKWNEDLGEYYNGDDFIWNSELQQYEFRMDNKPQRILPENVMTYEKWLAENKDSDDELTVELIRYNDEVKRIFRENPKLLAFSYTPPEVKAALNILYDLGIEFLPTMYERVVNDDFWSNTLIEAIIKITQVSGNNLYPPSSIYEDSTRWRKNFAALASEAEIAVNSVKNKTGSTSSLDVYGLLILPYISDEIKSGNEDIRPYLSPAVQEYLNVDSASSKEEMIGAISLKKDEIKIIADFIRLVTNG